MGKSTKVENLTFLVAILVYVILNCLGSYTEKRRVYAAVVTFQIRFCSLCLWSFSSSFFQSLSRCHSEVQKGQCSVLAWNSLTCNGLENRWNENDDRITGYLRLEGALEVCSNNLLKAWLILKVVSASKSDQFAQKSNQDLNMIWRYGDLVTSVGTFFIVSLLLCWFFTPLSIKSEFSVLALVSVCPFSLHHQEEGKHGQWIRFSSKLSMY